MQGTLATRSNSVRTRTNNRREQPDASRGVVDSLVRPTSAWHALAQVLRPVQLVITDEGLNGLGLHLINDTNKSLQTQLEPFCPSNGSVKVASATTTVNLAQHGKRIDRVASVLPARTIRLVPFNANDTEAAPAGEVCGINTGTSAFYR
jgi:hypothetical protein